MEDVDIQIEIPHTLLPKDILFDISNCNMPEPVKEMMLDPVDGMEWFR